MKYLKVLPVLLFLAVASFSPIQAQGMHTRAGRSASARSQRAITLLAGGVDYYSGSAWAYPSLAIGYEQRVAGPVTLGVELSHVAARVSGVCADAPATVLCPDQADPLWYATLALHVHAVVGRAHPYLGGSAAALMSCGGQWCRSLGAEAGLRLPVLPIGGFQVEARWRVDQRQVLGATRSKEARIGIFVTP